MLADSGDLGQACEIRLLWLKCPTVFSVVERSHKEVCFAWVRCGNEGPSVCHAGIAVHASIMFLQCLEYLEYFHLSEHDAPADDGLALPGAGAALLPAFPWNRRTTYPPLFYREARV